MSTEVTNYHEVRTCRLIRQIVESSDRSALVHFINFRRAYRYGFRWLLLPEFVWELRSSCLNVMDKKLVIDGIVDDAYSLTIAKFSNMPGTQNGEVSQRERPDFDVKRREIDCRNYYRPALEACAKWRANNCEASELEEERIVCASLQRLVVKHFYLSRHEVRRSLRPFATRYAWQIGDNTVTLWYPKEIDSKTLRVWLDENFGKLNRISAEDKNRIQAGIDSFFGQGRWVALDEIASGRATFIPSTESSSGLNTPSILAEAVSREKINHIASLRPAVRDLGKVRLRELILRIFTDLADNVFKDLSIANDFGLSKATFSRFAGSKWREKVSQGGDVTVPDLWKNTARVISSDPEFLDSAKNAGLLENIGRALSSSESEQQNET